MEVTGRERRAEALRTLKAAIFGERLEDLQSLDQTRSSGADTGVDIGVVSAPDTWHGEEVGHVAHFQKVMIFTIRTCFLIW
ncbi:hypothetical protein RCH07_001905 [Arthrobacter sp. CG_A4]|nr:hypothetical protein [Arthrobacter sp. CG_A4]